MGQICVAENNNCITAPFKGGLEQQSSRKGSGLVPAIYFVLKEKWPEVRLVGCSRWLDQMGRGLEGENGLISNQEV